MGPIRALLALVVCVAIIYNVDAAVNPRCPPPSKIYSAKPECREDYGCKHGKICCPNMSNSKSCADPLSGSNNYPTRYDNNDKYDNRYKEQKSGPGSYCGNVKCNSFQKCVKDPRTGRLICQ